MTELHHMDMAILADQLARREVSSVEVTRHLLDRAQAHAGLGAYLALNEEASLAQAAAADARLAAGERAPLLGVPLAHKDIFVTQDFPTTAGSKMLEGYRSPFDATVVSRLASAGAVTLGKLNCDEFAMGSGNDQSAYGPAHNPWDTSRVPGGSSGGSAAAVAARLVPAATGTDTGGSIRQPASFTGITGIKPTYGRCSRYGMVAYASSLDQAGPMARSARDCALLLSAMAGPDLDRDSTSLDHPAKDYTVGLDQPLAGLSQATAAQPLKGLRIGLPREFFGQGCAADVLAPIRAALAEYEKLGATLVDISLPRTELSIPAYYIIAPAEASSNLARYDGVRYGLRDLPDGANLQDMYAATRAAGFGAEVKRRILIGTYVLSAGFYDAYYTQAQKVRTLISQDFAKTFEECDVILAPTTPTASFALGEKSDDPLSMYLNDVFSVPASLAGLPAMSVPAGINREGLPLGLQVIGKAFDEQGVLNAGLAIEQRAGFTAKPAKWW